MSRSIFGWDLPPGCTHRMIDEAMGGDESCPVCCKDVDNCVCPECPACGMHGNLTCYSKGHVDNDMQWVKLPLSREQVVARTEARIARLEEMKTDESLYLDLIKDGLVEFSTDLKDHPDPWR